MVDTETAFSVACSTSNRNIENVRMLFELYWINVYGASKTISGDPQFINDKFKEALVYFKISLEERPARRHNKLGAVERKNAILWLFIQRLVLDSKHTQRASTSKSENISATRLIFRAAHPSNILYGSREVSRFELARGYTPSILELSQTPLSKQILKAHQEQAQEEACKHFKMLGRHVHWIEKTFPEAPQYTSSVEGQSLELGRLDLIRKPRLIQLFSPRKKTTQMRQKELRMRIYA